MTHAKVLGIPMVAALVVLGGATASSPQDSAPAPRQAPRHGASGSEIPGLRLDGDAVVFLLPDAGDPLRQGSDDPQRADTITALERCLEASRQAIESRGIRVLRTGHFAIRAPLVELFFPPGAIGTLLIPKDSTVKKKWDFKEGRETAEGLLRRVEKYFGPAPQPAPQPN
jgi:hypothetical protein